MFKTSNNNTQQITRTDSGGTVITLKSGTTAAWIQYLNSNDTSLGYIGVESNNKPSFYDSSSHEIALVENVIKTSDTAVQTITRNNVGSSIPLALKSGDTISAIRFLNNNGSLLGDIGVDENSRPYLNDGSKHPIPFSDDVIAKSSSIYQTISVPSDMPIMIKRSNNATKVGIGFENSNEVLGTLGMSASKVPIFNDGTDHEIALAENVVKLSAYGAQTIQTTGTGGFPLTLKGGDTSETTIRFMDKNSNILGYIGVIANDKPVFYGSSGTGQKEIALKDNAGISLAITGAAFTDAITSLAQQASVGNGIYCGPWTGNNYFIALIYKPHGALMFGIMILDSRETCSISYINGTSSYKSL